MTAISIKKLKKTYKSSTKIIKEALSGIDLEVEQGEFIALLGPNGAGKSTLINILAGLVNITSGSASIYGFDVEKQARQAKQVLGIVPQELLLDPFFTVRQVLENTAGYYGIKKKDRKTDEIINILGLKDKENFNPRKLSGGMNRRLLVAKAMVHCPKLLILDEPTAGVDVELRNQLWEYITKLNKQGTTILLTTHYLQEAEELCDRIAVINHGKIIVDDSKKSIMKIIDLKKIIVTFSQILTNVPQGLEKFRTIINSYGQLEVEYASSDKVQEIIYAISKSNIEIKDIATKESSLEDVFKYLTKTS